MIENVSLVTHVGQNSRRIKTGDKRGGQGGLVADSRPWDSQRPQPHLPPTAKQNSKLFWELKTQLLQMLSVRCFWEAFLFKPAKNSSINYPLYGGKISDK